MWQYNDRFVMTHNKWIWKHFSLKKSRSEKLPCNSYPCTAICMLNKKSELIFLKDRSFNLTFLKYCGIENKNQSFFFLLFFFFNFIIIFLYKYKMWKICEKVQSKYTRLNIWIVGKVNLFIDLQFEGLNLWKQYSRKEFFQP